MLKKTLESPLDCKEIQPVHPKGDQSWVFIGRTDVEAEMPILWPSDVKNWLIWKDLDAGKDWGQEEKGTTEDEMAGWHDWLNGRESGWTLGVGDGQGGLECCGSWGPKKSDTTQQLNWTELKQLSANAWRSSSSISVSLSPERATPSHLISPSPWFSLWNTHLPLMFRNVLFLPVLSLPIRQIMIFVIVMLFASWVK